jgi:hypothetical protein
MLTCRAAARDAAQNNFRHGAHEAPAAETGETR